MTHRVLPIMKADLTFGSYWYTARCIEACASYLGACMHHVNACTAQKRVLPFVLFEGFMYLPSLWSLPLICSFDIFSHNIMFSLSILPVIFVLFYRPSVLFSAVSFRRCINMAIRHPLSWSLWSTTFCLLVVLSSLTLNFIVLSAMFPSIMTDTERDLLSKCFLTNMHNWTLW